MHAKPHFVRCVKANASEQPLVFERTTVMRQIRALQLLETVNLMAAGEEEGNYGVDMRQAEIHI